MIEHSDEGVSAGQGRSEHAVVDRIQRIVDGLGSALALPVSVDDHSFRLQFYSPQMGMLDRVRIESILFRDSPEEAKQWVRSQGVAEARSPVRVPPSERLGLLPRICIPIPHEDALLGYLWIIDAEGSLSEEGERRAIESARQIAPLMFRRLFLERLDRSSERLAMARLIDESPEVRLTGFNALHTSRTGGVLPARIVVAAPIDPPQDARRGEALALAIEVALEKARGDITPDMTHLLLSDGRAVILLSHDAARTAAEPSGAGRRLATSLGERVEGASFAVGLGRLIVTFDDFRTSLAEAQDAAEIARRMLGGGTATDTRWLGQHRTLLRLPPSELEAMAREVLGSVLEPRNRALLDTLERFLDSGGDVAGVADDLDLHRSSVYARIRRLEELLGADLADGGIRGAVQHALIALRLASGPFGHDGVL